MIVVAFMSRLAIAKEVCGINNDVVGAVGDQHRKVEFLHSGQAEFWPLAQPMIACS
jgi:hypothetical protein